MNGLPRGFGVEAVVRLQRLAHGDVSKHYRPFSMPGGEGTLVHLEKLVLHDTGMVEFTRAHAVLRARRRSFRLGAVIRPPKHPAGQARPPRS